MAERARRDPAYRKPRCFYQRNEAGASDLCILEIGLLQIRSIVTDVIPNTTGPTWSPNGAFIVYTKNDDATFDPIEAIETQRPFTRHTLPVQTVGHGDVAVGRTASGQWRLAYIAQGTSGDSERSFKKLYVATVPIPNPWLSSLLLSPWNQRHFISESKTPHPDSKYPSCSV